MKHLDTSGWKFENKNLSIKTRNFDHGNIMQNESRPNPLQINVINKKINKENDTIKSCSSPGSDRSKILESLRELKTEPNPYLVLINRLDEEEGVRTPSVEDKLKLAEDHLRISTLEFCSSCKLLIDFKDKTEASSDDNIFLGFASVQDAIQPKVFDLCFRPPRTLYLTNLDNEVKIEKKETLHKKMKISEKNKSRKHSQQNLCFTPSDWFPCNKKETQTTEEELEFLSSTSTKAFLKFLSERKKEPPKIIEDIQKKVKDMKKEN